MNGLCWLCVPYSYSVIMFKFIQDQAGQTCCCKHWYLMETNKGNVKYWGSCDYTLQSIVPQGAFSELARFPFLARWGWGCMHARPDQHRRGAELHIAKCGSIMWCVFKKNPWKRLYTENERNCRILFRLSIDALLHCTPWVAVSVLKMLSANCWCPIWRVMHREVTVCPRSW